MTLLLLVVAVVVAGGLLGVSPVEAQEGQEEGTWSPGGRMQLGRADGHTLTRLPDGRVLLVGGCCGQQSSAELWDPDTREWRLTAPPESGREQHTATLLDSGKVLIVGGEDQNRDVLASAEVYDPETEGWTAAGSMATPREKHAATRLDDGRVLITGGRALSGVAPSLATAEIFDPGTGGTGEWRTVGSMAFGRADHAATRLADGKVLVTGGFGNPARPDHGEGSGDITDVSADRLRMQREGEGQDFAFTIAESDLPKDGKVTINLDDAQQGDVEYLDDDTQWSSDHGDVTITVGTDTARLTFTATDTISAGTEVTIESGSVLNTNTDAPVWYDAVFTRTDTDGSQTTSFLLGPDVLAQADVFDPASDTWEPAAPMNTARGDGNRVEHTANLLPDETVMVFSGQESGPPAEFYHPDTNTWQPCNSDDAGVPDCPVYDDMSGFGTPRASTLGDGTVLIVGYAGESAAQRYGPTAGEWWAADAPETRRISQAQTVLANGHVLVVGGRFGGSETAEVYSPETVPAPVVESVTPEEGSVDGGFEVTITGENLGDAVFASFGENDHRVGEVVQDSAQRVRVTAPRHPEGFAPVRLATPGGLSEPGSTLQVQFVARDGDWTPTGGMAGARSRHEGGTPGSAVLDGPACDTADAPEYCGKVLVGGGGTSELFDPETGRFGSVTEVPEGAVPPAYGQITVLDGPACRGDAPPEYCGKVLTVDEGAAGLYDPATNTWQACGEGAAFDCPPSLSLEAELFDGTWHRTVLIDGPECQVSEADAPAHCGTVLAGVSDKADGWRRMFTFDPATGQWTQTGSRNEEREQYAMILVEGEACEVTNPPEACGDVLVTSGTDFEAGVARRTVTAELYNPATGQWRDTAEQPAPGREFSSATSLRDGRVLVAGGGLEPGGGVATAEVFDPRDGSWQAVPDLPEGRMAHEATLLPDGRVMLAGGNIATPSGDVGSTPSVVVFDPEAGAEGQWSYTASMINGRAGSFDDFPGFVLETLTDGRVLAAGGIGAASKAELYSLNPGSVAGLVLDAGTGAAVEGAEVTVTDADGTAVGSGTTSAEGAYQVSGVPFGEYTVTADAAGYEAASQDGVTVDAGEATRLDFALAQTPEGGGGPVPEPAGGLVAGTVTDAETGESLEGMAVTADGPTTATATTDADGAYELAGLAGGSYTVTANAAGYEAASQAVEVVEGEAATADFALQPEAAAAGATGSVAGTVTDAGSGDPVVRAEVTVTDAGGSVVVTAGSDTSGAYTVEGLAPGDYTLTAEATGYEAASQSVTVAAGETAAADFALQPVTDGEQPVDGEEPTTALGGDLTSAQLVQAACDPAAVPEAGFGDIAGSVHEDSVACVAWYGLTLGLGDLDGDGQVDYGPNRPVTRDQMASFIARLAREAGVALPEDAPDAFGDDDGSVHEDNINALAAANITQGVGETQYAPRNPVSRDQMASFLARLAGEAGLGLPADAPDAFGDDDGSVHEDNINALAAANITRGVSEGVYAPRNPVSRGQMASFLGRLLGGFVESGIAPAGGAEVSLEDTSTTSGGQLAGEVFAHKDVTSLTADGCGLSEREVSVAADGGFTVDIPDGQPAGDCELAFAVSTSRGGDAPVQTARYGFAVTVEAGGA